MWVCICNAVQDHEVEAAIRGGATTREAVTQACGAGGDCGSCHRQIDRMIQRACGAQGSEDASAPLAASALVRPRAA